MAFVERLRLMAPRSPRAMAGRCRAVFHDQSFGEGTGLGLSISLGIARLMRGR